MINPVNDFERNFHECNEHLMYKKTAYDVIFERFVFVHPIDAGLSLTEESELLYCFFLFMGRQSLLVSPLPIKIAVTFFIQISSTPYYD